MCHGMRKFELLKLIMESKIEGRTSMGKKNFWMKKSEPVEEKTRTAISVCPSLLNFQ